MTYWDEETSKVVDKQHKGRGYELSKDRYVEIDEAELQAVEIESTHTVDIASFVPLSEIDKRYLDKPYYIVPDGKMAADAFVVIRDAMKNKQRVGLARIVMANRDHIIALEPLDKGILGTTLRYDYEVRDEKDVFAEVPNPRVPKQMLELAEHILETKAGHFDPKRFKDEYELALRNLVKRKAAGKKIEALPPAEDTGKVINLMEALRRSMPGGQVRRGRAQAHGSSKKKPPPAF
jgi:DNA end-binding protein Ku